MPISLLHFSFYVLSSVVLLVLRIVLVVLILLVLRIVLVVLVLLVLVILRVVLVLIVVLHIQLRFSVDRKNKNNSRRSTEQDC